MPIPRYERRVDATPLPGVRPQGQMPEFSSAMPEVARQSQQLAQAAAAEKKKADDSATQEAWAKAVQTRNRMVYDPQTGLAAMRGKAALSAEDTLLPQFDEEMGGIEEGLGNEAQRLAFRELRNRERVEFQGRIAGHTFQEIQRMEDDSFKAALGTAIDDGALNYRQPGKVNQTRERMAALIEKQAQRMGWTSEVTAQMKVESVSQMHRGIFDRELANSNVPAAEQAYLTAKKGKEATGADLTYMENKLAPAKAQHAEQLTIEAVQGISDQYMMKYSDASVARADMEQEYGDKPFFKAALSEFNRKFKDREDQDQFGVTDKAHQALELAMKGEPVDSRVLSALPAKTRAKIREYSEGAARWGADNISASGDAHLFLLKQAAEKPDVFMRTQLIDYGLEPSLLKEMRNLQLGMRNKDDKAAEELKGIVSQQEKVDMAGRALGFRPQDKQRWDAFTNLANKGIVDFQRRERRKMTDKEYQEYMDDLTIRVRNDKSLLNL